ncbi:hypothetical protein SAMN05421755_101029 [Nitrosomonas sp. Nm33]|nr:hypothetical protein SAMN05421755_101029 [Nitrosomonas sp. Nm33]
MSVELVTYDPSYERVMREIRRAFWMEIIGTDRGFTCRQQTYRELFRYELESRLLDEIRRVANSTTK